MSHRQYTYESASMAEDLGAYTSYLLENGWTVRQEGNFNDGRGEMQLSYPSKDSGNMLIMKIFFREDQYTIRIEKLSGLWQFIYTPNIE